MPNMGFRAGTAFAALFRCVTLSAYLVLFVSFCLATYKKSDQVRSKRDAFVIQIQPQIKISVKGRSHVQKGVRY